MKTLRTMKKMRATRSGARKAGALSAYQMIGLKLRRSERVRKKVGMQLAAKEKEVKNERGKKEQAVEEKEKALAVVAELTGLQIVSFLMGCQWHIRSYIYIYIYIM